MWEKIEQDYAKQSLGLARSHTAVKYEFLAVDYQIVMIK